MRTKMCVKCDNFLPVLIFMRLISHNPSWGHGRTRAILYDILFHFTYNNINFMVASINIKKIKYLHHNITIISAVVQSDFCNAELCIYSIYSVFCICVRRDNNIECITYTLVLVGS